MDGGSVAATGPAAGGLKQSASGNDRRAIAGDPEWRDYTVSLKARKLSGAEGFLILFHVRDDNDWLWWNLGGWGNSRHGLRRASMAANLLGADVPGKIETIVGTISGLNCKANESAATWITSSCMT